MGRVRVAVVGCGWWATSAHLPALRADEMADLVALVDSDMTRLERAGRVFSVDHQYARVDEMLIAEQPDAVVVAVPPAGHYRFARAALEAGAHVLVEKPMTVLPEEAHELVDLASAGNLALVVGYPWHYQPQARWLRSRLQNKSLGELELATVVFASVARELYAGRPFRYRDTLDFRVTEPLASSYGDPASSGGGQAQAQVTHAAALLVWLTGLEVTTVSAFVECFGLPVDLVDAAALSFTTGALGVIGSTGGVVETREEILEFRLFGRAGHVVWNALEGTGTLQTREEIVRIEDVIQGSGYPADAPVRNLVRVAAGEEPNLSPGQLGLAAVELIDALYRSARTGRPANTGTYEEGVGHVNPGSGCAPDD